MRSDWYSIYFGASFGMFYLTFRRMIALERPTLYREAGSNLYREAVSWIVRCCRIGKFIIKMNHLRCLGSAHYLEVCTLQCPRVSRFSGGAGPLILLPFRLTNCRKSKRADGGNLQKLSYYLPWRHCVFSEVIIII